MGFSEAFPELDFHRAQGSGHRKRDNKQKGWSEWRILVRGKVCCVDRSSTCKFISVFLTGNMMEHNSAVWRDGDDGLSGRYLDGHK